MAYSTVNDEEDYQKQLLAAPRKGKTLVQEQLEREFHVGLYTAAERAKLKYLKMNMARSSRCLEIATSEWAQLGGGE